jgi:DNA-binding NarL/FixJ family response regulator
MSIGAAPLGPGSAGLTGAQWAVARGVARGDSDREIGAALHLSTATVHEHVTALHGLLGMSTRPRLVAMLAGGLRGEG